MVPNQRQFAPLSPGDIGNVTTGCHTEGKVLLLLASGGHRTEKLNYPGQPPTSKNYSAPNLNSAKTGKHELKGQYNDELISASYCHFARSFFF